jgi:hypothetical protein
MIKPLGILDALIAAMSVDILAIKTLQRLSKEIFGALVHYLLHTSSCYSYNNANSNHWDNGGL